MQKNTDTVPAMLTPGEFVIRRDAAEQIGPEKLQMLNNIDRLSNSALIENAKSPVGYQEGGEVGFKELADLAKLYGEKQGITLNLADYTPEGGRSKEGYARKFNLPEGLPKTRWRGSYAWDSGNDTIEYIRTDIHDGHAEIIDITSKLNSYAMQEYNKKVGEWLDLQQ